MGATGRLANFVTDVLAEGLKSSPKFVGLVVDGVRVADFESYAKTHGSKVACVLRIACSRDTMMARLGGREGREGDGRLGLSDGTGDDPIARELFNSFQTADRVDAFLKRTTTETDALRTFFGDRFSKAVYSLNGELSAEECLRGAASVVRASMVEMGHTAASEAEVPAAAEASAAIDWRATVGLVA